MFSISKNDKEFETKSFKRLPIFSKITGTIQSSQPTRNLLIKGVNPSISTTDLQFLFTKFGELHILDTQNLAQCEVTISYFDIRISKLSYSYFSLVYSVQFLPNPPFEEFSDILYINLNPPIENTPKNSEDYSCSLTEDGVLVLKFYDLRKYWSTLEQLERSNFEEIGINLKKKGNFFNEEKENQSPGGFLRKSSENLMKFVIDVKSFWDNNDYRTTLMIKNIPNKYTQTMLLESINKNHAYTFDFMYLPIDFKNKCNVGYAFINFIDCRYILSFYQEFDGKKWEKFNSEKICALSYARIQGRLNLEKHFQSSSIMGQDHSMRPIILSISNNI